LARTQGGLEELDDEIRALGLEGATLVPVDVTDYDGIDRLGGALHERFGKLDILIANAGMLGPLSPITHVTPKDFTKVMDTNLTASWRLIRSMDPLLQASTAGRAVFVSSSVAQNVRAFWGPYAISKAAIETLARTYAAENAATPIRANILNPGPVRTHMRAQAMPGEDPETLPQPDALVADVLAMCTAQLTRTGELYDIPSKSWKSF
jgi:NAD(P)-dependent dehydrogenase (short-subunit alcohol dehydrogenase family)